MAKLQTKLGLEQVVINTIIQSPPWELLIDLVDNPFKV